MDVSRGAVRTGSPGMRVSSDKAVISACGPFYTLAGGLATKPTESTRRLAPELRPKRSSNKALRLLEYGGTPQRQCRHAVVSGCSADPGTILTLLFDLRRLGGHPDW